MDDSKDSPTKAELKKSNEIITENVEEETEKTENEGNVKESSISGITKEPISATPEEQEESLKTEDLANLDFDRDQKTTLKQGEKSEIKEEKKYVTKKRTTPLSNRMEYLSRPKKDTLDGLIDARLDGSIPEDSFPSWAILPLPTKIPFAQCPIQVTGRKLGTNLFLPPPANDFDLEDENNYILPFETYNNLYDSNLRDYVRSKYGHLNKDRFITESGRVVCTLKDINDYRVYQRRILAAEVQKKIQDEDEEFRKKRAEGMEQRIKRDMQKYHERRTQGQMRRWIKNTVASIKESSMQNQMIRDMKVLNSQIKRQRVQRERVEALEERYHRLYAQHIKSKYDAEEKNKSTHVSFAKKDIRPLEKLCKKKDVEKLHKKEKLDGFWKRKSEWQKKWVQFGNELDKIREQEKKENIEILKKTGRLPLRWCKRKQHETIQRVSDITDTKSRNHGRDEPKSVKIKTETLEEPSTDETEQSPKEETSQELEEKEASGKIPRKEPLLKSSVPEAEDILERIKTELSENE